MNTIKYLVSKKNFLASYLGLIEHMCPPFSEELLASFDRAYAPSVASENENGFPREINILSHD